MITNNKNRDDISYILNNLRSDDKVEAKILVGEDYINKTLEHILNSDDKFFLSKDKNNTPYAMGGINKTEEKGVVSVWLLSTDKIVEHRHFALKKIKEELEKTEADNWFIFNYIYEKNHLAKIWLKKFGFNFVKSKEIPEGFELFYKKRNLRGLE